VPLASGDEDSTPAGTTTPKPAASAPPEVPGSSSARRGLRTRTAAQQNPYQHHEKIFEDLLSGDQDSERNAEPSPKAKTTKLAQVSYPVVEVEKQEEEEEEEEEEQVEEEVEDEETAPKQEDDVVEIPSEPPSEEFPPPSLGKHHYKGKGRKWKKTQEDEDEDFKASVKPKLSKLPKRKLERRKSTQLSAASLRGYELGDEDEPQENRPSPRKLQLKLPPEVDAADADAAGKAKQKRRPKRASHVLSEEFIRDDSDSEVEEQQHQSAEPEMQEPTIVSSTPRKPREKKSKGRKSDQSRMSNQSRPSVEEIPDSNDEDDFSAGQKRTPKRTPPKKKKIISVPEIVSPM
jgi:hypothetical protein